MARPTTAQLKRYAEEAKEEGESVGEETGEQSAPGGDTDDAAAKKKRKAPRKRFASQGRSTN